MVKLTFVIGYGGRQIEPIAQACQEVKQNVSQLEECRMYFTGEIAKFSVEDIRKILEDTSLLFVYSYEVPENLARAVNEIKHRVKVVSVDLHTVDISNVDIETIRRAREYFLRGGIENYRRLLKFLLKLTGIDVEVEEPVKIPWDGVYHPDYGIFEDVEQYLSVYKYRDRPLVGLLFYRSYLVNSDLETVNLLIRQLEEEGLGVITVFTYGHRDTMLDISSKVDVCRKYFLTRDGRARVHFLIDFTSFFFTTRTFAKVDFNTRPEDFEELNIVKMLDVPIMRPVLMWYRTVQEWLDSPQGVDYLTQVYQVIMPEVDGLIEPIVVTGTVRDERGIIRRQEPVIEHVKYIARRVRKWVELRLKRPEERKIAIVLHNAPCKGLEANIAVGLGLDVLESVVKVLRELAARGYKVENIPSSGKELARMFLEKRAISDFRWTSVRDIVERGGALDMVDLNTYLSWFYELPESVREKMIRDWGHPEEIVRKGESSFAGMVYNGKFVVPGLRFGNIVVLLQPKFGCAGPRCDGKVCKILHDPNVTPPHQWLAVYRWITRVFKADVIIHFGTHGYLEFRPGKGVGLSWMCWPEISIDDVPHLYVYVVTNPMEGVIAKRRGYATLIDHVYPPMSIPEVFEQLEDLLAQYARARGLGEESRAKILYDRILELARKCNVPIPEGRPEEVIESIHRYVDMIKSTQINLGLHVLGQLPPEDKLIEYVLTVFLKDTGKYRSIIRVLCEALGIDYDQVRERLTYISELGMASNELIDKLRQVVKSVLRKLIAQKAVSDEQIREILYRELVSALGIGV